MVYLTDLTGRQADLVAVGAVARSCGGDDLLLRQLALDGLLERGQRVARAGDAHRLIDVGAAGQRVADGAAQTGGRAAERLDLGRVVVGLVFKLQQPVLLLAVDVDLDLDRAGVDLLGLVQVLEQALLLEGFGADGGQVHQGHRLVLARVDGLAQLEIFVVGVPDVVALNLHVLDAGGEGGVAAVVGPVGIDHADLGDGWGALFGLFKVLLAEGDISQVHRQAVVGDELLQALLVQIVKVFQHRNVRRNVERGVQRLHRLQRRLHRLDGVDQVFLDAGELPRRWRR